MTKDEALKLALESLEYIDRQDNDRDFLSPEECCDLDDAITAIRVALASKSEALAEQDTVLPGGGHVPAIPVAVYGYCPECGGAGVMRERRPNGDDKCTNGHRYPSSKALAEQPAQQQYQITADKCQLTPVPAKGGLLPAQQQEPVAWMWRCKPYCDWPEWSVSLKRPADSGRDGHKRTEGYEDVPLYTSPPASKPWVGLTDEEINEFFQGMEPNNGFWLSFARAIEAKLKEKNT